MSSQPVKPLERSANIFINYRREDSAGHAGRLFDGLSDHFPGRLFMDVDTIAPGIDFDDAIKQAVGSCEVLIVIIGRDWLTIKNAAGQRRLDAAGDFVRLEVEAALARSIRVIPVLVQGMSMPGAEELPPSLAALARRNAIELSDVRWSHDVGRLAGTIKQVLKEKRLEESTTVPVIGPVRARAWPRAAVFLLAAVVLVGAGWISKNRFASASGAIVEKPAPLEAPSQAPVTALEDPAIGVLGPITPAIPLPRTGSIEPVAAVESPPMLDGQAAAEESVRLPEVEITAPKDGAKAGKCVRASGTISGLGTGQRAFLGMRNREGKTYSRVELFPSADGTWSSKMESSSHDFEIFVLISTSPEAGEALHEASLRDHGLPRMPRETFLTGPVVSIKTSKLGQLKSGCGKGP